MLSCICKEQNENVKCSITGRPTSSEALSLLECAVTVIYECTDRLTDSERTLLVMAAVGHALKEAEGRDKK